jgi:hypothetical protein
MQHIENGIAVKAVVAKLKSEGQACALSQSRLGQFLWAVWILKSYPILQAIKCAVKAWSSPSDVCLACLKAYLVGGAASIFQDGNTIQKDDKSCFSFWRNCYVCRLK